MGFRKRGRKGNGGFKGMFSLANDISIRAYFK